ncbi:hypothetical protein U9M48_034706 [Paspalum notatum var. saurae]|uniref:Integrase catalytic domain-containing protein n=1 Tax=Paspalum notatum var. saurae TaxID=547442 RepID=A0AAQ3U9M6_PASNO
MAGLQQQLACTLDGSHRPSNSCLSSPGWSGIQCRTSSTGDADGARCTAPSFDTTGLLQALQAVSQQQQSSPSEWFMDTGASGHMTGDQGSSQQEGGHESFQCDNGTEFITSDLRNFFIKHGITYRLSCPYTSAQNGKAERAIRTTNDVLRTLLFQADLPPKFWVEALHTATYLINRRPCKPLQFLTPYQALFGEIPDYCHLRVFGCLCYPNMAATMPHKLAQRSSPCVFIGYPSEHKGYRATSFLIPRDPSRSAVAKSCVWRIFCTGCTYRAGSGCSRVAAQRNLRFSAIATSHITCVGFFTSSCLGHTFIPT